MHSNVMLTRVMSAAAAGIVLLLLLFSYSLNQFEKEEIDVKANMKLNHVMSSINEHVRIRSEWMHTTLTMLQESRLSESLLQAIEHHDRKKLTKLSRSFYQRVKQGNNISHMYFLDRDRKVVLRMHQPHRFGDVINRATALQAEQTGHAASGVELGPLGTLSLRVVVPWLQDGHIQGYLELANELEDVFANIESNGHVHLLLTLHKRLLNEQGWKLWQAKRGSQRQWGSLQSDVVAYPPSGEDRLLLPLQDKLGLALSTTQKVKIEGDAFLHGVRGRPFVDVSGNPVGAIYLFQDISRYNGVLADRFRGAMFWLAGIAVLIMGLLYFIVIRTERARKQAESKLKLASEVISTTHTGLMITDETGKIVDVNPAFEQVTGYQRDEAIGQNPNMLKSGRQNAGFYRNMWEEIREHGSWKGKIVNRKKNGDFYTEELTINTLYDDEGGVKNYIGLFSDVTEMEQLQKSAYELQRMQSLGTLVGGIAHEFNNLLGGMTGNLYLALRDVKDRENATEKLKVVERLCFEAAEMVRLMMAYARMGISHRELFSIDEYIQEVLDVVAASQTDGVTLRYKASDEKICVDGDRSATEQVLLHLINNAMDALEGVEHAEIVVTCELYLPDEAFQLKHPDALASRFAKISVADNGCGIPADMVGRIFDPFFTTKEVGSGTGLGLAMVQGTVASHGGVVEASSTEGEGSIFTVYCPAITEESAQPMQPLSGQNIPGNGNTVLIVDDDKMIATTATMVLEKLGYQTMVAGDGRSGVETYCEHASDIGLVLMDVLMPGMSGIEAAAAIRKFDPNARIVFVTGYDVSDSLLKQGTEKVLSKPYRIDDLSRLLDDLFGENSTDSNT